MDVKYVSPVFDASAYNCPHCGIYATQEWQILSITPDLAISLCTACHKELVWHNKQVIYPANALMAPPHAMLPPKAYHYYNLARSVSLQSVAAACAYLRQAINILFVHIGGKGENPDDDVDSFINNQLGSRRFWEPFRKAHVFGYHTYKPLVINEHDDEPMMDLLFYLVNSLVEETIASPMALAGFYAKLSNKKEHEVAIDGDFYERP